MDVIYQSARTMQPFLGGVFSMLQFVFVKNDDMKF